MDDKKKRPGDELLKRFYKNRYDQKVADKYREIYTGLNVDFDAMCAQLIKRIIGRESIYFEYDSMEQSFLKHMAITSTRYLNFFYKGIVATQPEFFAIQARGKDKPFLLISFYDLARMQQYMREAAFARPVGDTVRNVVLYVANNLEVRG